MGFASGQWFRNMAVKVSRSLNEIFVLAGAFHSHKLLLSYMLFHISICNNAVI